MSFNSVNFLVFFPIVVLLYFAFPKKVRMYWLLVASYYFYMSWNVKYGLLLFASTAITYLCGIILEYVKEHIEDLKKRLILKRCVLALSLTINLALLFYFKYFNFIVDNINRVLGKINITIASRDILLPVGISFFIFQALGYTIDVYREDIKAEKNLFRYALFVSFFPQLVAGPIERSKNLLEQLRGETVFDADNAKDGLLTIAYGLFLKIVVADNLAAIVDPIYDSPDLYSGMALLFASILFAFQIYCDFNGYTQMAIGSAKVLGFKLNKNFDSPYMSVSVKEFWKRWHISLNTWFVDYLYIPLGGSRKGKIRKAINTIIIFACSGLWHGAAWHYLLWGLMNGVLIIIEDMTVNVSKKIKQFLKIDESRKAFEWVKRLWTFVLIDITMIVFRAMNVSVFVKIFRKIIADFKLEWFINFEFIHLFEDSRQLIVVVFAMLVLFAIDMLSYRKVDIKGIIFSQQVVIRWAFYFLFMLVILYWGLYGTGYEQKQFIYFQF